VDEVGDRPIDSLPDRHDRGVALAVNVAQPGHHIPLVIVRRPRATNLNASRSGSGSRAEGRTRGEKTVARRKEGMRI
jgi:hypothetical protein